jgi:hypothetical protein
MFEDRTALFTSEHGQVHRPMSGGRYFLGFDGAWMALTRKQLAGVGNAIANILNCPLKARHLSEGMLLRTKDGDHRMPLT